MDSFDYTDEQVKPTRNITSLVLNILTGLILVTVFCLGAYFVTVFVNPQAAINPFPPATLPAVLELPTPTPTPRSVIGPTWTPTVTPQPTNTDTPSPIPSLTQVGATQVLPFPGILTAAPTGDMPYVLQPGNPVAIPNIGHPDLGCSWMGVAGQATGSNDAPVVGLFVELGGALDGQPLNPLPLTMTGTATQYGAGGYELKLADTPIASNKTLWIQLFDQAKLPLSEKIFFETFAECEKNLILINFNQMP